MIAKKQSKINHILRSKMFGAVDAGALIGDTEACSLLTARSALYFLTLQEVVPTGLFLPKTAVKPPALAAGI
jgi:hypothetical protein